MKSAKEKGAVLGLVFGIFTAVTMALLINGVVSIHFNTELMLIVTIFLFFSAFFGARAGRNTIKGEHPVWIGCKSTFLTTYCTLLLSIPLYILLDESEYYSAQDPFFAILVILLYTTLLGGIPMLILGSIYGYSLRRMLQVSNK